MFFPGETITHRFVIPFAANEIDHVIISYMQNESIVLEKTITSGFISEDLYITAIEYQLSQVESMVFEDATSGSTIDWSAQVNVYTKSGSRHTSREVKSSNGIQYMREIMNPKGVEP